MPVDSESTVTRALIEIMQKRAKGQQAEGDQGVTGNVTSDGDSIVVNFPKFCQVRDEPLVYGYRVPDDGVFGYRIR